MPEPEPELEAEDVAHRPAALCSQESMPEPEPELEAEDMAHLADSQGVVQDGEFQSVQKELEAENFASQPPSAVADLRGELLYAQQEIAALRELQSTHEQELQSLRAELAEERAKAARLAEELQRHRRERDLRRGHLRNNQGPRPRRSRSPVSSAVPEFEPLSRLELSDDHRRCRNASGGDGFILAVARQGLSAGRHQFTVRVISMNSKKFFYIGVATANAPRDQHVRHHGLFLSSTGNLRWNDSKQRYCLLGFDAGDRITMRLDSATRTAAFEINGVCFDKVQGVSLPEGPLYPAVIFGSSDDEAEFVAPSIWRLGV